MFHGLCLLDSQIGGAFGSADKLRSQLGQELLEAWHRSGGGSGDNMTRGILLDGLVEKMGKPSPSLAAKLGPLDDWLAVNVVFMYLKHFRRSSAMRGNLFIFCNYR